jgi:hypothetical protein
MVGPRTIATWTPRLLNIFPSTTYLLSRGPRGAAQPSEYAHFFAFAIVAV